MTSATFCSYDKPGSVGGPFSWLRRLLPLLRDRGIDSRCLFLTHYGGTGPVVEGLLDDGFKCDVINCHDRMVAQVRWVLDHFSQIRPDVFVPNFVVSACHASRWIRASGIPTVGVLHSDDAYYQAVQDEFVFGDGRSSFSNIVCVSREIENQVRRRQPTETSVCRIPYGVVVPSESVEHSAKRFRIAYVGRLAEEQKRISATTQALIRVCREVPHAEAVLFGDGPDRGNVEKMLASEGLGVAVRLGGNVPNSEIQRQLLQCDVIVLLSDYEGLPIALLEAMACGCVPVCLTMRSGISELIQHNVSGLIVTDREDSFVTALKTLAADPALREQLARNARQTITQEYSQEQSADSWADHLRALAAQSSPRKLAMPRRIVLPERNPALESAEQRLAPPSGVKQFIRKSRMWAGRVRRRLL